MMRNRSSHLAIGCCAELRPFQRDPGARDARRKARAVERLGPREQEPRSKGRRALYDEDSSQRTRIRVKNRLLQFEVLRALRPGRPAKPPSLRQMLAGSSDPRIDQRVIDRHGDGIDALLLRCLVRVIEIEFVHELVERHREIGRPRTRDLSNFG